MNLKLSCLASLAVLASLAGAQTQTTETKVGVSTRGVEVTRKKTTKMPAASVRQGNIKVNVDGDNVAFPDQGPVMRGSRVLVPLRGVFEKMGATVNWDRGSNTVTAVRDGRTVVLPLSSNQATVEGRPMRLDQPAQVMNGRALVPLRFLSESLGATVDWRASDLTVDVKSGA